MNRYLKLAYAQGAEDARSSFLAQALGSALGTVGGVGLGSMGGALLGNRMNPAFGWAPGAMLGGALGGVGGGIAGRLTAKKMTSPKPQTEDKVDHTGKDEPGPASKDEKKEEKQE